MNNSEGVKSLSRFVEWILSFFQDAVNSLFDMLSGGQTDSALMWLMKSWKGLFMLLLFSGIALNIVIYFVRWKPHWWWFAKKRMVVNDELISKRKKNAVFGEPRPKAKPSTIVPRKDDAQSLKLSTIAPSPLFKDSTDSMFGEAEGELMEVHPKKRRT